MRAVSEEKTQLRVSDIMDEDDEDIMDEGDEDIDPEHDHVYLGDGEWMLRSYYEEVFGDESDEGDSNLEEGFDEDSGDEDVIE